MNRSQVRCICRMLVLAVVACGEVSLTAQEFTATASSVVQGSSPDGAIDGDRFSTAEASLWKGQANKADWWWQVEFVRPRPIGAILQIVGDHPRNLSAAPTRYVWQFSQDGEMWQDLPATATDHERRMYRVHRLSRTVETRFLRLRIFESLGKGPTVREDTD